MKVYKIATGWAIVVYVCAALLIIVFGLILLSPFIWVDDDGMKRIYPFMAPVSAAMLIISIVALLDTIKGRLMIDNRAVQYVSTFTNRQILLGNIKGYRVDDRYVYIEAFENAKRIRISNYVGGIEEIKSWLEKNYSDLDGVEAVEDRQSILYNDHFGNSVAEREIKLNAAKRVAKIINIAGCVISAWFVLYPKPYEYALIAVIMVPVICVVVVRYFGGLIKIVEKKEKTYPSVFFALFLSCMAVCFRSLIDFDVFEYKNIWSPAIIITIITGGLLLIGGKYLIIRRSIDYFAVIITLVYLFGYGFGTVVALNCFYDTSEPAIYQSEVVDKRISSGKSTTYYLRLSAWGPQHEDDDVSVSKELYNQFEAGDTAMIYFRKGRFNVPWFEVKNESIRE